MLTTRFKDGRFASQDFLNERLGRYELDHEIPAERNVTGEIMKLHRGDGLIMTGVTCIDGEWYAEFCHEPTLNCVQMEIGLVNRFTKRKFSR